MASVTKEMLITARPDDVWAALRDFDAVHERLAPGFVTDSRPDGEGARVVTFFNGAVAREILVGLDDDARRLAYSVVQSPLGFTHHNASAQVFADGEDHSRFVWTTDALPDALAARAGEFMERGMEVIKQNLEGQSRGAGVV